MKRFSLALALLFALLGAALAQSFPSLTGRVVDGAELLDSGQEARLVSKLADHETKSGQQVVVATIPDLGGRDIEGYANGLFRAWGLGDATRNDGVLFLVARDDRKLRIEVGYGLEGTLTDALASYIIRTEIVPAFRQGNFALGIERGADAILDVLASDAAALEDWQSRARPRQKDSDPDWIGFVFVAIWLTLFFGPMLFMWMVKRFGKKISANKYRWLGQDFVFSKGGVRSTSGGWTIGGGGGGGWSSGGGGFSGGGGSSGGGGASGSW